MGIAPVFLLVEPSPILRSSLHEWLKNVLIDARIFIAANGLDALWLAAQEQPSHILVEMDLPDISGLAVLQQIRQGQPNARIIATGWYDSRFLLDSVQSAGADGFVLKNKLYRELLPLWQVLPE
jgi:DNA-binding NarL/FixJ family response regulator